MARMSHYNRKGLRIVGPLIAVVLAAAIVLTAFANLSTGRKIGAVVIEVAVAVVAGVAFGYRYRQLSKRDS